MAYVLEFFSFFLFLIKIVCLCVCMRERERARAPEGRMISLRLLSEVSRGRNP